MTTEHIDIVVTEKGSRIVKRNLEDLGQGSRTAAAGVSFLRNTLSVLGGSALLIGLSRQAETYTQINNRLRLVTSSSQNLRKINDELFASAQRTRTSYEATVDLYSRVARNAETLGLSQKRLLAITETVNQAIRVSGGSTQEAEAGVRQFGQALGSGALRGDELVSVLENMPRLARAIADGMGVTIGQLRQLGSDGELTSAKIVKALEKTAPGIAKEFAQLRPTIGEAFTVLNNSAIRFIGQLDQTLGLSQAVSAALIFLAQHLDTVAKLAVIAGLSLAAAFAASRASAIISTVSQVIALERALGATSTASALFGAAMKIAQGGVRALTAAIAANPIGLLIVAITAAISYLVLFRDQISVTSDGVVSLGDVFRAIFSFIQELIAPVVEFFRTAWVGGLAAVEERFGPFAAFIADVFSFIVNSAKAYINAIVGLWVGAYRTIIAAWSLFGPAMRDIGVIAMNGLIGVVESGVKGVLSAVQSMLNFIGSAAEAVGAKNPFANLINPDKIVNLAQFKGKVTGAAAQLGNTFSKEFGVALSTDYVGGAIDSVLARAREIANKRIAETSGGTLNPSGLPTVPGIAGDGQGKAKKDAKADKSPLAQMSDEMRRIIDLYNEIKGPQIEFEANVRALDTLLAAGIINVDEYAKKWRELRIAFLDTQNSFAAGAERGFLKVAQDLGDAAKNIETVIKNTFSSAEDAIVKFVTTGKVDIKELVNSVIEDLVRLVTKQLILAPIANMLGGLFGGGGGGGGFLSGLGGIFSSLFGGGLGFATGGGFNVGGGGGVDSQMVAFRATPGERVNVTRPGQEQDSGGGRQTVIVNINAQDADSFRRSESQIAAKLARAAQRGRRNL
jgi:tape measure domain-containing protein